MTMKTDKDLGTRARARYLAIRVAVVNEECSHAPYEIGQAARKVSNTLKEMEEWLVYDEQEKQWR